jgi:hypothetical protein
MTRKMKGRYFSVRFSADMLERIERLRLGFYGSRCTFAEAIRRLVEDRIEQLMQLTCDDDAARAVRNIAHFARQLPNPTRLAVAPMSASTEDSERFIKDLRRVADALRLKAAEISGAAVDLDWIVINTRATSDNSGPLSKPTAAAEQSSNEAA